MPGMDAELSIGAFSRMTFLSVKALRHYHEIGLLAPASIDPDSGYRHYAVAQVPIAQVIRRLRDLGMPLGEIATIVRAPDVDTRNATIIAHLQRMEDELARTRETVASLRALLEGGVAPIAVEYRGVPEAAALALEEEIGIGDAFAWLDAAFSKLRSQVGPERAGPDGALFSSELLEQEHGRLVAFIPVAGGDRILPATEYAIAVHRGTFEDLDQTFAALGAAVAERAIGVNGPIRENYLTPDRTEVCWPVFRIDA
jgi:DNA-binding transcriptional MerR regulator